MGVVLKSSRNNLLLLGMKNIEYCESSISRVCITGSGDGESQRKKIENVFNFRKSFYFHFPSATTTTLSCLLFSVDHITVCRWSNRAEHNDDDHHVDKDQNDWKNLHGSSLKGTWFIILGYHGYSDDKWNGKTFKCRCEGAFEQRTAYSCDLCSSSKPPNDDEEIMGRMINVVKEIVNILNGNGVSFGGNMIVMIVSKSQMSLCN